MTKKQDKEQRPSRRHINNCSTNNTIPYSSTSGTTTTTLASATITTILATGGC